MTRNCQEFYTRVFSLQSARPTFAEKEFEGCGRTADRPHPLGLETPQNLSRSREE